MNSPSSSSQSLQSTSSSSSDTDSSTDSSSSSNLTWIEWFCSLPGHDYFVPVIEEFIDDDFNLTGLSAMVPFFNEALNVILDSSQGSHRLLDAKLVESSAELLYGLIHARYILSRPGLHAMLEKLDARYFGVCPRTFCYNFPLVPMGRYDQPGLDTVKLYCHNCMDIYHPPSSRYQRVDGAFFGTTFPHLLFQTYPDYYGSILTLLQPNNEKGSDENVDSTGDAEVAKKNGLEADNMGDPDLNPICSRNSLGLRRTSATFAQQIYIPRIYGFRVSPLSISGPKLTWLRWSPDVEFNGKRRSDRGISLIDTSSNSSNVSQSNTSHRPQHHRPQHHRHRRHHHRGQQQQQENESTRRDRESNETEGESASLGVGPGVNMTISPGLGYGLTELTLGGSGNMAVYCFPNGGEKEEVSEGERVVMTGSPMVT